MVEATIEDLAITIRTSRESDAQAVSSTTKIFKGAKPSLKADMKPVGFTEIEMLPKRIKGSLTASFFL